MIWIFRGYINAIIADYSQSIEVKIYKDQIRQLSNMYLEEIDEMILLGVQLNSCFDQIIDKQFVFEIETVSYVGEPISTVKKVLANE